MKNNNGMIIAVPADGPDFGAKVADRFSTAKYLLIIDINTGEYEALINPFTTGQHGAGIQAVILAVGKGAKAILTGFISPAIVNQLKANDIKVMTGMSGTISDAVERFKKIYSAEESASRKDTGIPVISKSVFINAVRSAGRQFATLLPVMLGVVLLTGLFDILASRELLSAFFSGNAVTDTLWGALFGSIFAGNPINSYIIGDELLKYGVSLFAVTAFIVTWVSVGLVQLPAEIAAFGKRFALIRNALSFIIAIPIAFITVLILNLITG